MPETPEHHPIATGRRGWKAGTEFGSGEPTNRNRRNFLLTLGAIGTSLVTARIACVLTNQNSEEKENDSEFARRIETGIRTLPSISFDEQKNLVRLDIMIEGTTRTLREFETADYVNKDRPRSSMPDSFLQAGTGEKNMYILTRPPVNGYDWLAIHEDVALLHHQPDKRGRNQFVKLIYIDMRNEEPYAKEFVIEPPAVKFYYTDHKSNEKENTGTRKTDFEFLDLILDEKSGVLALLSAQTKVAPYFRNELMSYDPELPKNPYYWRYVITRNKLCESLLKDAKAYGKGNYEVLQQLPTHKKAKNNMQ